MAGGLAKGKQIPTVSLQKLQFVASTLASVCDISIICQEHFLPLFVHVSQSVAQNARVYLFVKNIIICWLTPYLFVKKATSIDEIPMSCW